MEALDVIGVPSAGVAKNCLSATLILDLQETGGKSLQAHGYHVKTPRSTLGRCQAVFAARGHSMSDELSHTSGRQMSPRCDTRKERSHADLFESSPKNPLALSKGDGTTKQICHHFFLNGGPSPCTIAWQKQRPDLVSTAILTIKRSQALSSQRRSSWKVVRRSSLLPWSDHLAHFQLDKTLRQPSFLCIFVYRTRSLGTQGFCFV